MSEKCEKCGGELMEGMLTTLYYPNSEIGKPSPKRSAVACSCCKNCGHIQDFKAKDLNKLQ